VQRPRVIPSILVNRRRCEKTQNFKDPIYLGDIHNVIKIFNDLEVDEIIITDYTTESPDLELLKDLSSEAFMPMSYGGGIKSIEDVENIIKLGFEKISVNTLLLTNPLEVREIVKNFGSSTVIGSVDIKKNLFGKDKIFNTKVTDAKKRDLKDYIKSIEDLGVGEILITFVDNEATLEGPYDGDLNILSSSSTVPMLYNGGIGSLADMKYILNETHFSGVVCGAYFVLNGKLRSPLISYLNEEEMASLISDKILR